jgi:hypothetical protein
MLDMQPVPRIQAGFVQDKAAFGLVEQAERHILPLLRHGEQIWRGEMRQQRPEVGPAAKEAARSFRFKPPPPRAQGVGLGHGLEGDIRHRL